MDRLRVTDVDADAACSASFTRVNKPRETIQTDPNGMFSLRMFEVGSQKKLKDECTPSEEWSNMLQLVSSLNRQLGSSHSKRQPVILSYVFRSNQFPISPFECSIN